MTYLNQLVAHKPVSSMRKNHALEHASLHILARRYPGVYLAGLSDARGFRIFGNVSTEDIQQSVDEALSRLQRGERTLAYHPNCGTNFATTGTLAGLTAWLGMLETGRSPRARFNRLPLVMLLVTLVIILTRPLGPYLQRNVTTDPNPAHLHIVEIKRHDFGNFVLHRVVTRQ
ncbi:MAG: DUF6391 domain-containing protein [Anaerolineaceae bacterium]